MDDLVSGAQTRAGNSAMNRLWHALPFVSALVLIGLLYQGTFGWWWHEWTSPGSFYAHAVFVPFFVAAMIWRNRDALARASWNPSWAGLGYLIPAMLLMMLSKRSDVTVIQSLSFMLLVLGMAMMLIGKARTRLLLFPLLFVLLMMPLVPDQLINSIAFPIQITSATIATKLLNLMTLHSVRSGTMIQMEDYKMAVELPCSGFKTLLSLLTFSAAFAYLVEAAPWKRWTLFLTTIPLSLFINALRITFIGIVGQLKDEKAASTFHDYSGFIVLTLAFLFLFNFARMLQCNRFLGIPMNDEEEKKDRDKTDQEEADAGPAPAWWTPLRAWRPSAAQLRGSLPYVLAINLLLALTLGIEATALKPVVPLNPIATTQVPTTLEANGVTFTAQESPLRDKLSKAVQEELSPSRIISRNYDGSDGSAIEFFMTAGNGRKVFHDPHTCMIGGDAVLKDIGIIPIPIYNKQQQQTGTVQILEMRFTRKDEPQETEMMMCYVVEGKVVQRTEEVRNKIILQTLIGDAGMPSYFFRVTQRVTGTDEQKRQQLIHFISAMWSEISPVLQGQVPGAKEDPPVPYKEPGQQ